MLEAEEDERLKPEEFREVEIVAEKMGKTPEQVFGDKKLMVAVKKNARNRMIRESETKHDSPAMPEVSPTVHNPHNPFALPALTGDPGDRGSLPFSYGSAFDAQGDPRATPLATEIKRTREELEEDLEREMHIKDFDVDSLPSKADLKAMVASGKKSASSTKKLIPPYTPEMGVGHEEPIGEGLEDAAEGHIDAAGQVNLIGDDIAQKVARALAGAKQKPTQEGVSGFMGSRNIENEDIKNSAAAGTNATPGPNGQKGAAIPSDQRQGDAFIDAKESHNTTTDTLRPSFGIAPANAVVPTKRQQVESDLLFNDFSVVAPGFGLGVTNKMFLLETARENKIVYREPLAEPRKYDGPTGTVEVPPLQWQNEITRRDRNLLAAKAIAEEASGALLEARAGDGSLNILGDDFGQFQRISDKGLKRPADSPLEPVLRTPKAWERIKPLPGIQWARKNFRRLFDSARYPERFEPNVAMEGGSTLSKRNSLATFPFPITSG